jgi:hypothetical protein
MRKFFVVAAALVLGASQAAAQGGGGGTGAAGGGSGPATTGGTSGAPSSSAGAQAGDQAAAQQEATSTRPTEGGGGKNPHPVVEGGKNDARFGNEPAPPAGPAGRPLYEQGKAHSANQGAVDQANEVSGRIAAVNPADREVAIDAGSATTQVRLAPDAKITVDGKTATLKDLRPGANVRASLERSGDMPVVKKLDVTTSKK